MANDSLHLTSRLLEAVVTGLDISEEQYELAVRRYEDLGEWLVHQGIGEPEVYPQGSFRLGTVVRPAPDGDFDIDLVFLRDIEKGSISQKELRDQAEQLLRSYIAVRGADSGRPKLVEKGRCFTLVYSGDKFHMDVLPVIPDRDGDGTAVLLSDRELREWQHSNPIGYANWFWATMRDAADAEIARLAEQLSREVEDVPKWRVRTTLQRAVQLLKLHRDSYFSENPDDKPASILITTLAARSYGGEHDLYAAFCKVACDLPTHAERRGAELWVPNPAHPEENFADKWNTDPERKRHFDAWCRALATDVEGWGRAEGIDSAIAAMRRSLGAAPVQAGAEGVAASLSAATAAGELSVTNTGNVNMHSAGIRVREHKFDGQ